MFELALPYRDNDLSLVRGALRMAGLLMSADDHLMKQAFEILPEVHKMIVESCMRGNEEVKRFKNQ